MRTWDNETLDRLRRTADPAADVVAGNYIDDEAGEMFHRVVAARYADAPAGNGDDPVASWLAARPELPDWADRAKLERGAEFFEEWGIQLGLGLFLSSLPLAYASHDGVQVLALTAELETDTKRRVLESAQFVLDVTQRGGLEPGSIGYTSARQVRLMHAGVRHLIVSPGSRVPRTPDDAVWPRWDDSWGVPLNQEHLLGAMLSFSSSLLKVLDALHLEYDADGAEAYCHLWNVVGCLLGIEPGLLPMSRNEMDDLEDLIRVRNEKPSEQGAAMTAALIELVQSFVKFEFFKGAPVSTMRLFIGDPTADLLGAPQADWTRVLIGALTADDGPIPKFLSTNVVARFAAKTLSKRVLTGFVEHERDGGRPAFAIPTQLGAVRQPGPIARARERLKKQGVVSG